MHAYPPDVHDPSVSRGSAHTTSGFQFSNIPAGSASTSMHAGCTLSAGFNAHLLAQHAGGSSLPAACHTVRCDRITPDRIPKFRAADRPRKGAISRSRNAPEKCQRPGRLPWSSGVGGGDRPSQLMSDLPNGPELEVIELLGDRGVAAPRSAAPAVMYGPQVTILAASRSRPSLRHDRNGRGSGLRFRFVGLAAALALLSVSLPSQSASATTIDGSFDQTGPVSGGQVFNLPVLGRGGVPASGVGSVALNVTVTRPTAASFVTVWPAGQSRPNASNLNFTPGQTVPNMVIVPVGAGGQISIFNETGTTDVLVDVLGWFPIGPSFTGLTPARLMDSRIPTGGTTDGAVSGIGPLAGGQVFNLPVQGRGGVPASGVGSVALNVTVARPTAASFVTVWPAGRSRPNASNLNFTPGQTVPNMVIVPVGAGGQISIFNETGTTDVLVDVLGWFPIGPSFTGLTPARLMDSRIPTGGTTDGAVSGIGPLAGGQVFNLPVQGRGGVPASGVGSVASERHRREADSRQLRHRLASRSIASQRIEPQLHPRPNRPEHGHRSRRRRRPDLHRQRDRDRLTYSLTCSAGSPSAHPSPASHQHDSWTAASRRRPRLLQF